MEKNIIHTLDYGERVTSTYAEIYFDDYYCGTHDSKLELNKVHKPQDERKSKDEWTSPSDLLIGIIELKPPFTSKIIRGKTHEGILAIGDGVLENERAQFLKYLRNLIHENDAAWNYILKHEKELIEKKVTDIYQRIFEDKSQIMKKEISIFYEKTLQELENHLRSEIQNVLISAHAYMINDMNRQIKQKLSKERVILEEVLKKKYDGEVQKIKRYYKLLLDNELYRGTTLVNEALRERNEALNVFYRQTEAENITSSIYVLCTERKKCKIKQFLLKNYHSIEISEKYQKIQNKQNIIDDFKEKETHMSQINNQWEEKVKKILKLFLKFISYSLKLLPEQTTFLLDLQKMVVLQLNEIQKMPKKVSSILVDKDELKNMFKFEEQEKSEPICENQPFVIVGDMSDPVPPRYGSRESLLSEVDLPYIRVQRQFVYAKCHNFEEIKALLEAQTCKCSYIKSKSPSQISLSSTPVDLQEPCTPINSESSNEPFLVDDIHRFYECPARGCKDWLKKLSFPYLDSYLEFTQENFKRVEAILSSPLKIDIIPKLINPKDIAYREVPFAATKEPYHNTETQYSSQQDLYMPDIICPCLDEIIVKQEGSHHRVKKTHSATLNEILMKRKMSLMRLIDQNPRLLKMFTDESFDFKM